METQMAQRPINLTSRHQPLSLEVSRLEKNGTFSHVKRFTDRTVWLVYNTFPLNLIQTNENIWMSILRNVLSYLQRQWNRICLSVINRHHSQYQCKCILVYFNLSVCMHFFEERKLFMLWFEIETLNKASVEHELPFIMHILWKRRHYNCLCIDSFFTVGYNYAKEKWNSLRINGILCFLSNKIGLRQDKTNVTVYLYVISIRYYFLLIYLKQNQIKTNKF
jgi:hypothetical protein